MDKKWKIGIVGAGGITEQHLIAARDEPRVEIAAISDAVPESARKKAEQYNIPVIYVDYREMLSSDELDVIVVCLPNYLHAPVTLEALRNDKHVLCEKPMSVNAQSAEQMTEVAHQVGKVLMIAQNNRFRPDSLLVKQLADENRLGEIYHAKAGWIRRKGIPGWGSWFTQKEKAGGGPLLDIGVHMLDLTMWLMGNPKPKAVFGHTEARFGPKMKGLSEWGTRNLDGYFDVEDFATALITFENGASLSLDANWAAHLEKEQTYVQLYGSEGGVLLDFAKEHVTFYHDVADVPTDSQLTTSKHNERILLLRNFIDVIEGKAEAVCKTEQSVSVVKILEAIYLSSQTGEMIHV